MPFFEYKCKECGAVFTLLQKRDAAREGHECTECGGTETERVFSVFAAQTAGGNGGGHVHSGPGCCCSGGSCPYN